ncbi:hypothetical protein BJY01DRAFT_208188 [Aspergillus pseudoustus]|uniref:Uncharacterized protein n=1 Tax=Aspergillus pseudoustus TaxID=1810923 RepID=A0ABR4KJC9_9EURO
MSIHHWRKWGFENSPDIQFKFRLTGFASFVLPKSIDTVGGMVLVCRNTYDGACF